MARSEHYKSFNFLVEIDGESWGRFTSVNGVSLTTSHIKFATLGSKHHGAELSRPGSRDTSVATFQRGLVDGDAFWEVLSAINTITNLLEDESLAAMALRRVTIEITPLLRGRTAASAMTRGNGVILSGCYPAAWALGAMSATESGILVEEIQFKYESIKGTGNRDERRQWPG